MKVLIDTDVILDILYDRAECAESAARVFKFCEVGEIEGFVSALSVLNVIYIMRKEINSESVKEILEKLSLIFTIVDLTAGGIKKAAYMSIKDCGDALLSVCASRIKADYIVTRNTGCFENSQVTAITPSELINRICN